MGNTGLTLAGAIAVVRVLAGRVKSLPSDAGRIIDPRFLRFGVAAGRLALLDDGTACLAQSGISLVQLRYAKCRGDHRLPPIKVFRDKYTAHLGEPKNIQEATYRDLFTFGAETAKAMEPLALATGIAIKPINTDPDSESSPEAFWAPWKDT